MDNEMKIRKKLYIKMTKEYNEFVEKLKLKTPDEIIERSYEKVIKEELLYQFCPECEYYDMKQIRALNKVKEPLDELYHGWMKSDGGIHQALEDSIEDTLNDLVKEQKKNKNSQER